MTSQNLRIGVVIILLTFCPLPLMAQNPNQNTDQKTDPRILNDDHNRNQDHLQDPNNKNDWIPLFNQKDLTGWKKTQFGSQGRITVADKTIEMEPGTPINGITYQKKFPNNNFEIELEAKKISGNDFFCALTFPVEDSFCSFVVGGWGGTVVGLSNIDDQDASENDTTEYIKFEKDQWYVIRVRVAKQNIQCWIDDKLIVNQSCVDKKIGIRPEVDLSCPLGIGAFETDVRLRNIRYRVIDVDHKNGENHHKPDGNTDTDKTESDKTETDESNDAQSNATTNDGI